MHERIDHARAAHVGLGIGRVGVAVAPLVVAVDEHRLLRAKGLGARGLGPERNAAFDARRVGEPVRAEHAQLAAVARERGEHGGIGAEHAPAFLERRVSDLARGQRVRERAADAVELSHAQRLIADLAIVARASFAAERLGFRPTFSAHACLPDG